MSQPILYNKISYAVQTEFIATENNSKVMVYEKIEDATRLKLIQMVSLYIKESTSQYFLFLPTILNDNS